MRGGWRGVSLIGTGRFLPATGYGGGASGHAGRVRATTWARNFGAVGRAIVSDVEADGADRGDDRVGLGGLLDALEASTVAVVGDAMLDRYLRGDAERISPEAPVPVLRLTGSEEAPGGAANVAAGIAALGGECRLVAAAGRDEAGDSLVDLLDRRGVDASGVLRIEGRPTTVKTRVLSRGQQMLRLDRETRSPPGREAAAALAERLRETLDGADALAVADYGKGVLADGLARRAVEDARRREVPVVVDPWPGRLEAYRGATVVTPNAREAAEAAGRSHPPGSVRALRELRRRLGAGNLLVTLGDAGMRLVRPDGSVEGIPGRRVEVFDVTGAGDTVTAVLAAGLPSAPDVLTAARLANRAAALEVQTLGARPVSRRRLDRHLEGD